MSVKTVISGVITLALSVTIAFTPIGVPGVMELRARNVAIEQRKEAAANKLATAEATIISTVQQVNDAREFDVYYGDIENISATFRSVGIKVDNIVEVYPMDDFREGGGLTEGSMPAAVRYKLTCKDMTAALGTLEQMELPIYSVVITGDTSLEVTFMTGGEL